MLLPVPAPLILALATSSELILSLWLMLAAMSAARLRRASSPCAWASEVAEGREGKHRIGNERRDCCFTLPGKHWDWCGWMSEGGDKEEAI
eukprot:4330481-Pleurochrysis_carterae.AAC.2